MGVGVEEAHGHIQTPQGLLAFVPRNGKAGGPGPCVTTGNEF